MTNTFSAKQVATRIGTDAKTLRKFLRSAASPVEAVGQGGRYEFPKADLPKIKKAFVKWQGNKRPSTVPAKKPVEDINFPPAPRKTDLEGWAVTKPSVDAGIIDDDDREPTTEELDALDAELELTDDDLEI